jgi:hypothetical protein
MNQDFLKRYKEYSNIDLLKIANNENEYQPEAIEVAKYLLIDRVVTQEEIDYVEKYYHDIQYKLQSDRQKIDSYKNKVKEVVFPINPYEELTTNKWLNFLLLIIAVQYLWILFSTIKGLIKFFKSYDHYFGLAIITDVIYLPYIPFIFYLLYKKNVGDGYYYFQIIYSALC